MKPRQEGTNYPFAIRMRARDLYLRSYTYQQISDEIAKEQTELIEADAKAKEITKWQPFKPIPLTVISYWARKGNWEGQKQSAQRYAEKDQVKRVKKALASEVASNSKMLSFLQGYAQQFLTKIEMKDGKPVLEADGKTPKRIPKTPEDWPMDDPVRAIQLLLQINTQKSANVKMITDLLGDALPKIDPEDLHLMHLGGRTLKKED